MRAFWGWISIVFKVLGLVRQVKRLLKRSQPQEANESGEVKKFSDHRRSDWNKR